MQQKHENNMHCALQNKASRKCVKLYKDLLRQSHSRYKTRRLEHDKPNESVQCYSILAKLSLLDSLEFNEVG